MTPVSSGVRIWLAVGRTDMRPGMTGLALRVQEALGRDPHAGDLYVFRGARGDLAAKLAVAKARASDDQAIIAHQKLQILKLTRQFYGQRSERAARLLDRVEIALEEPESSATEDRIAAEIAVADAVHVAGFTRRRAARKPFPEHLPSERVVEPGPAACLRCGASRLRKLGEDVTETREIVLRRWKVVQHVREKFTCRGCEKVIGRQDGAASATAIVVRIRNDPCSLRRDEAVAGDTTNSRHPGGLSIGRRNPQPRSKAIGLFIA